MAISRLSNSGIKTGVLKYDSALVGYPPVMPAPTAADGGTGSSATITFSAVSGATNYRAISSPGGFTGTASSSPITVSGLTTGTSYTFQVQAQNAVGYGGYSAASNSVTPALASGFESIATVTASTATSSLTISSIPQTYKHLQVRAWVKTNNTASTSISNGYFRLNADTSTGRNYADIFNSSTNLNTAVSSNSPQVDSYSLARHGSTGGQSDVWAFWVLDIYNYTNTSIYKSYVIKSGAAQGTNATSGIAISVGSANITSAITSISFPDLTGNDYKAGTYFALYGIKGA